MDRKGSRIMEGGGELKKGERVRDHFSRRKGREGGTFGLRRRQEKQTETYRCRNERSTMVQRSEGNDTN